MTDNRGLWLCPWALGIHILFKNQDGYTKLVIPITQDKSMHLSFSFSALLLVDEIDLEIGKSLSCTCVTDKK